MYILYNGLLKINYGMINFGARLVDTGQSNDYTRLCLWKTSIEKIHI